MDGYELATTLNTIPSTKDLKLILLTSAAQEGDGYKSERTRFFRVSDETDKKRRVTKLYGKLF